MIDWLVWIVLGFLVITSILDFRFRQIPSVMLTAMLFAVACLNPANLIFGALGFIMAYLLIETDFFSGVADLKVFTIISFMIPTIKWFFVMIILVLLFGFIWKVIVKLRIKKAKNVAFIPVFLFVYLAIMLLGGI